MIERGLSLGYRSMSAERGAWIVRRYDPGHHISCRQAAGVPLLFVATALGHSDTRMVEKHYGYLASSLVANAILAAFPSFGSPPKEKVKYVRDPRNA